MAIRALLIIPDDPTDERSFSARVDPGTPSRIGRSPSCDIVLRKANVSAVHARVRVRDGQLIVSDAGSRNGTLIEQPDGSRRLGPDEEVCLDEQDTIRIGPYRLVPCDLLGDDVVLASDATVDGEVTMVNPPEALPAVGENAAGDDRALQVLAQALAEGDVAGDPAAVWGTVLRGLVTLTRADRGFLLSPRDGQFVLRAAQGSGCLSRRFLEMVAERTRPLSLTPADRSSPEIVSPSMEAYDSDVTLTGVPFRTAAGVLVALGYLERPTSAPSAEDSDLTPYAAVAGAFLELAESLDRETRRARGLESRGEQGLRAHDEDRSVKHGVILIGNDPRFLDAVATVERASESNVSLLIRGPSGSGKEQLAQLAHRAGKRREHPLVMLNCAALPETLVESELFGADKGAYTDAGRDRKGAFEQAHCGTLFLDEVGDLPLSAQAKILRVIETGEVVRVGGSRHRVDVRLVTATHRDLEKMVRESAFREDLYYRLRVVEVELPTLADRREDVLPLAEHFLRRARKPDGQHVNGISVRAADRLTRYAWPGNIRELRNVIDRAAVLDSDGILDVDDLPADLATGPLDRPQPGAGEPMDDLRTLLEARWQEAKTRFEQLYFKSALERHGGAVQRTAKATGVDRRTLSTKIAQHGLRGTDE